MAKPEGGVLKLVHPGHYIEIHQSPVLASKIMEENPRHFITRPDVFKFPWIVVRPESLLMPGRVLYIVPCHTLYRLVHECRSPVGRKSPMQRSTTMIDERKKLEGSKSCLKKQACGGSKASGGRRVVFRLPDEGIMVGRAR